jgi:tripartite-type tricarboxylate transporter receptor subunit TctC
MMKFSIEKTLIAVLAMVIAFALVPAAPASGYPERDVTMVVPWGAGGGTDLTIRSLAEVMHREMGVNMPVLNMGGASGSLGMQDVWDSPKDGYKILGTSMSSLATVQIMGLADIPYTGWYVWNAAFTPNAIVVKGDSPYQTIEDLIAAMKASPDTITMSSAGVGSSGHVGGVIFAQGVGVTFRHIPYEGGNPAIVATLGGEVVFTAQLLSEMVDYIRSGDLRALASLSDQDMTIGNIVIPSIKKVAPEMAAMLPMGGSFGIMVPKGTPDNIVNKIDAAYKVAVASKEFANFADNRGMVVFGYDLARTAQYLAASASKNTWTLFDAGVATTSPETFGIPRL